MRTLLLTIAAVWALTGGASAQLYINLDRTQVAEGTTLRGTVATSTLAPAGGTEVTLWIAGPVSPSTVVTIPAGQKAARFAMEAPAGSGGYVRIHGRTLLSEGQTFVRIVPPGSGTVARQAAPVAAPVNSGYNFDYNYGYGYGYDPYGYGYYPGYGYGYGYPAPCPPAPAPAPRPAGNYVPPINNTVSPIKMDPWGVPIR